MSMRYDIAVIGTGPAGVSAAITAKVRNKNVIIFGSNDLTSKLASDHTIQNYPGLPAVKGNELKDKLLEHLKALDIEITEEQITSCYSMGDYFSMLSKTNTIFEAKTVIVASGVNFGKSYEGEQQFLGRGVSYCATCDGALYKGKTVAVIAQTPKEESEAKFLSEICAKVYYIPLYKDEVKIDGVEVIRDEVQSITGALKANKLVLKGQAIDTDCIFILRDAVSPSQLVPGLALDGNHISVNRNLETNIKGCFAAGDITGLPYQYVKAAGEGNTAALSAVSYLAKN